MKQHKPGIPISLCHARMAGNENTVEVFVDILTTQAYILHIPIIEMNCIKYMEAYRNDRCIEKTEN